MVPDRFAVNKGRCGGEGWLLNIPLAKSTRTGKSAVKKGGLPHLIRPERGS